MSALDLPQLSMAAARGLTLTVIAAPSSVVVADLLRPHVEGFPAVTPWLPAQLTGALFVVTTLAAASWSARSPQPQRLAPGPRGELVGLGILLGAVVGFLASSVIAIHSVTFALTCFGGLGGGGLAGAVLWRGQAFAGASLGIMAGLAGLVGALVACIVACGPLLSLITRNTAVVDLQAGAGCASLVLAGCFLAAYHMGGMLTAADPLVPYSALERPPQRSA